MLNKTLSKYTLSFLLAGCLISGCATKAGSGAIGGGIGGAAIGGIVGGGEGALIGGAVGAIGGALVGHALDENDRSKKMQITTQTLVDWKIREGLSERKIIQKLNRMHFTFPPFSTEQKKYLKYHGFSNHFFSIYAAQKKLE